MKLRPLSLIVKVINSLELESELRLRFQGLSAACRAQGLTPPKIPSFNYVGMYAGATKPKPFQRKRANLSHQKQGKLPPLSTMRDIALARHQGSGAPVPTSLSKRVALAFEHVYKGTNSFVVVQYVSCSSLADSQESENLPQVPGALRRRRRRPPRQRGHALGRVEARRRRGRRALLRGRAREAERHVRERPARARERRERERERGEARARAPRERARRATRRRRRRGRRDRGDAVSLSRV